MLNKLVKIIEIAAIVGVNGLDVWGNRIDVFYEDGPTLVAEGIDGIELPEELFITNDLELWEKYYFAVTYVGLRLNLPEELVRNCEDKYWEIYDKHLKQTLEEFATSEENFHIWCYSQKEIHYDNYMELKNFYCSCAYMLKIANEKNYLIPGDFCKRIKLYNILNNIHLKGNLCCCKGFPATTPGEKYIRNFGCAIKCCFFYEESSEEDKK